MVLLEDSIAGKKFDSRIVEQNIDRGLIKASEYEQFLNSLPDESENADWVDLEGLAKQDPVPPRLPKVDVAPASEAPAESRIPSLGTTGDTGAH